MQRSPQAGIQEWLKAHGLAKYAEVFAEHEITLGVLPHLTEPDVDRMNLPTGPRRLILREVEKLRDSGLAQSSGRFPDVGVARDAERRQLTVMFCDLVGSTQLAEQLDPESLKLLFRDFFKTCKYAVSRYDGYVAQHLGDGLMAYFGWPAAHEDDAERSLRAALEIVHAIGQVTATPPLEVRIGVATGTVVVGEIIPGDPAEGWLAVGETLSLARRLQELAQPNAIVMAKATKELVGAAFELSGPGTEEVKGFSDRVEVWRLHAVAKPTGRFEAARGGVPLTPFVGREREVEQLLGRWLQARKGDGQVVLIGGEPGIGKSRLTQVLRERLEGEEHVVLRYQCSPYHRNSSLYPVLEQLELVAGFTREDGTEQKLDKLEGILVGSQEQKVEAAPLLAALLSLPTERYPRLKLSPQKRKEKTLEVLIAQVESLSRRGPVLMVFEDAHWVDPTTQEALDAFIPRVRRLPILLAVTFRPEEYVPPWIGQPHVGILGLERLGRQEGAELVARVARGKGLPSGVLEQIVARTDGVPLFVEELTKSVLESGLLRDAGDEYALQNSLPSLSIPASLRDSLLARLDRLSPVKHIIQTGACIGREFSYELLARVCGLSDVSLEAALGKLTEAGLVYRRGTPPQATYTFKHALVQDAAYDSLLKSKRQLLHAQLAEVLETHFGDRIAGEPELLAHHHTEGGNLVAAIPWWCKAGNLGLRRVALKEAVSHFRKGLALIALLPPSRQRDALELTIREPLNAALTGLHGWAAPAVSDNATAILELAKRQGEVQALGIGLWGIWVNTITQGRVADSLHWAQRLLAEGDQAESVDLRIFGHGASMISLFYLGELLEAQLHGNRVLALYDPQHASRWMQVTAHDLKTLVGVWACQWTWMLGFPDQALRVSEEKDAHARRMGNAFNLGFALTLGGYAFDYRCEPKRLFERLDEADQLEREQSVPFHNRVMVPQLEGLAHLRSGRFSEAIVSLSRGLENWNKGGGHSRVPYLKSALAEAVARQGDLDAGLVLIDECLEQIQRPGWQEKSHLAEVLRLKGWMLLRQGRSDEAEVPLRAAIDWARQQQAKSWELRSSMTLAELLIERGDRAAARALLAPIYGWFTEGLDTHDLTAARSLLKSLQ